MLAPLSARRPLIGGGFTASFEQGTGDVVQSDNVAVVALHQPQQRPCRHHRGDGGDLRSGGGDSNYYLRVTASYNDGHGATTLQATSEFPTRTTWLEAKRLVNMAPAFPDPLFTGGVTGLSVPRTRPRDTLVGTAPQATDTENASRSATPSTVSGFTTDPPFEIEDPSSRQIRVTQRRRTQSITRCGRHLQRHGDGDRGRASTSRARPPSTSPLRTSTNGPWRSPTRR